MNKRWLVTIGIIVLALIIIGVMQENGMFNFEWTGLTIAFAALAGPYHVVKNWLIKNKETEELLNRKQSRQRREHVHREEYDTEINERKKQIEALNKQIEEAEKRIEILDVKKENIEKEVNDMSIEELQNEGIDLFGA